MTKILILRKIWCLLPLYLSKLKNTSAHAMYSTDKRNGKGASQQTCMAGFFANILHYKDEGNSQLTVMT